MLLNIKTFHEWNFHAGDRHKNPSPLVIVILTTYSKTMEANHSRNWVFSIVLWLPWSSQDSNLVFESYKNEHDILY